jgi:tetratricopeptide (TPR) repeat protein
MNNKKIVALGGGLLVMLTLFFGCGEHAGEKEYNKAVASWKDGDYSRAQGQMEKAIRKLADKEKKAVANNELGIILWNLDKQELAVEKFKESCRLTGELTGANLNLGIALFYVGQLEQAEFEFTKILSEQPDNATVRAFIGLIHMEQKNWASAAEVVSSGLKSNPSDPAGQNALALTELHLGENSASAINRLKQTITVYPDYAPAAYNLAVIYDQWLSNKSAALSWYKQYLGKAGTEGEFSDVATKAITRLEGTSTNSSDSAIKKTYPEAAAEYIAQGSKLHTEKKYREAIALYTKAVQADSSQKTAYYNMGLSHYELKNYKEATASYNQALELDNNFSNARYMLSLSYAKQSKWKDAEREAKILKDSAPAQGTAMLKYISDMRK